MRPLAAPTSWVNSRPLHAVGLVSVGLMIASLVLWQRSLVGIDVEAMSDLGLVSVLPPTAWCAYGLLVAGFCVALNERPLREWLLACHVVALVVMLYALPSAVEDVPRLAAAWRHVGVIDYVTRTGTVDPSIDAYFNWPGFFVLAAFLQELAGFDSAVAFLRWAPLVLPLLFLAPLVVIARSGTSDRRLVWLAIWLFYAANWVGQDYFAPQALSFFLYLTVLGVLLGWFVGKRRGFRALRSDPDPHITLTPAQLRWFTLVPAQLRALTDRGRERPPSRAAPSGGHVATPAQRAGLLVVLILVLAASVPMHQLTPFAALVSIAALTALGYSSVRALPILLAVLIGAWMSFMAISYLSGHLGVLAGGVGALGKTLDANVGNRLQGSADHTVIVYVRLVLTAFVWALAALGAARSFRRGFTVRGAIVVLAVAPFALIGLQPYGGEVLLRVYLFTLPFAAFLVASLFYSTPNAGRRWWTTATVGVVSLAVLSATLFARYGNERMEHFTRPEIDAVTRLYEIAPAGSVLISWGRNLPWKFRDYDKFDYRVLTEEEGRSPLERPKRTVQRLEDLMRTSPAGKAYFVVSRSQVAENELLGLAPRGSLERVESLLFASRKFDVIYRNADVAIFALAGAERQ